MQAMAPLTASQLRKMAAQEREAARLAVERAELYDRQADAMTAADRPGEDQSMLSSRRRQVSRARASQDPLVIACDSAGLTLRMLAERVGCSHALLSAARAGRYSIRRELAERIQSLVGFQATRENWPKIKDL